jgi:hypothetical protein
MNNASRASGDGFLKIFHTLQKRYTDSMVSKGFHINDGKLEKIRKKNSSQDILTGNPPRNLPPWETPASYLFLGHTD